MTTPSHDAKWGPRKRVDRPDPKSHVSSGSVCNISRDLLMRCMLFIYFFLVIHKDYLNRIGIVGT